MRGRADHKNLPLGLANGDSRRATGAIGFWDVDLRASLITGNASFAILMGLDVETVAEGVSLDQVLSHVRPEDRLAAASVFSQAGSPYSGMESRFGIWLGPDNLNWISITSRSDGDPRNLVGVVMALEGDAEVSRALEASEFRFKALAESLPQNVFSTDANGVHDFLSRRWFEFTGHPYGPIYDDLWLKFLHKDDYERTLATWHKSLAEGSPYDTEYRYLRHDGQYRWMRVMALPERDQDGRITRWFGTATDIHETKLMEVEHEVISAELNHRIKNLFAVFGGLISLSARPDRDAETFAEELRKRLSALSIAHDLVGQGQGAEAESGGSSSGVSLHALIDAVALPYRAEGTKDLTYEGRDLALSQTAATPMTLIIHELLTNAIKHGALVRAGGTIAVDTHQDDKALYLNWTEAWSEPLADGVSAAGFGSGMLETVVRRLLHGSLERDLSLLGLNVRLRLPLDKLSVETEA